MTIEDIDKELMPKHIAIIMDGNRRWAKERGLDTRLGHKQGAETLEKIAKFANQIGLEYLTVYAFSTENWKRTKEEVGALMILLENYLDRFLNTYLSTKKQLDELGEIEYVQKYPVKLKIFILMDLDDVNDSNMVDNYKNGQLFSKFKFAKSIVPLYNDGNLEEVIASMGYKPPKHKRDKNKVYTRMFSDGGTVESIEIFLEDCKKCKKTNMELLVQHVIDYAIEVGTYNKN